MSDQDKLDYSNLLDPEQLAADIGSYTKAVNDGIPMRRELARTWFGIIIVAVYAVCVVRLIWAGATIITHSSGDLTSKLESVKSLGETTSVLVVPIITLVLGYYFATKDND